MKHIYVVNAENQPICTVNGLQLESDSYTDNFLGISELSFTVDRYIWTPDGLIQSTGYEYLKEGMYLYVTDVGFFRIASVTRADDSYEETKEVSCESCEVELKNRDAVNFLINMGITGSKEMIATDNVDSATGLPKDTVAIYDADNPELSFLDLIIEELPGWSIGTVDASIAIDKVNPIEVDSQDIYSLLMETFCQANEVIVTFDRKQRLINCYSFEKLERENDTTIFIRYENLANSVTIQRHNDGIYTRFTVAGADSLGIAEANLGEDRIENLLWMLTQVDSQGHYIYGSETLATKYKAWYDARETLRLQYVELSKTYNQYTLDINDCQSKNAIDALNIDLSTYSDEELEELKKTYILTANVLVGSYASKDSSGSQVVDSEGYAVIADMDTFKASAYYEDWNLYVNTLIPNIETQLYNNSLLPSQSDLKKDLITTWETDWDLYGVTILTSKLTAYNKQIDTLYSAGYYKSWDELTDDEKTSMSITEAQYTIYYDTYNSTVELRDACQAALTERQATLDQLTAEREEIQTQREALVTQASKTNTTYGFTENELAALSRLYIDTDYSNEYIGITSLDDIVSEVDIENELLLAAAEELEIESQEQLGFEIGVDNLFNIPEFTQWQGELKVGSFIRVGILDDYYVRLRVVTIQRKLFDETSNDLTLTFSNLLRSNNELSDMTTIFQNTITSAKNQIVSTYGELLDGTEVYLSDAVLQALANSNVLQTAMNNTITDTFVSGKGIFEVLLSDYSYANTLEASTAVLVAANIDKLFATYSSAIRGDFVGITADTIKAGTLSVERLIIRPDPDADPPVDGTKCLMFAINNLGELDKTTLTTEEADQYLLNGKTIVAHSITADEIQANTITTNELDARAIKSLNYEDGSDGIFSNAGTLFYLGVATEEGTTAGYISSKNFAITADGDAYFRGHVVATSLSLGSDITIGTGNISGLDNYTTKTELSDELSNYTTTSVLNQTLASYAKTNDLIVYVKQDTTYGSTTGTSTAGFLLSSDGLLTANNAVISGAIYATSLTLGSSVSISSNNVSGLSSVATSGSYSDLDDTPTLSKVATSGNYTDLSGTPTLSAVATSGSYTDLNGTPVLATVATTGSYSDLASLPDLTVYVQQGVTIGSTPSVSTTGFLVSSAGLLRASNAYIYGSIYATSLTLGTNVTISSTKVSGLSTVATSGDYDDLSGTPDLSGYAVTNDLAVYVKQDTTYGSTPSSTTTGFSLSSQGLLTASNAVIYGKIFATQLTLGSGVTIGASNVSGLSSVATTGSYSSLSGTPTLSTVATTGSYSDLSGTPDLSDYVVNNDLTVYVKQDTTYGSTPSSTTTGFKLSSAGLLTASNAVIYGRIYATSLTLGSSVTISTNNISGLSSVATTGSYSSLSDTPDLSDYVVSDDLTVYVQQDTTYGSTSSSTATGFSVSSKGLLTANNAIIHGAIYATSLTLGSSVSISTSNISGLDSYTTNTELSNTLSNYTTTSTLSSTLSNYTTTSTLNSTLSKYTTTSTLNSTLANYATTSSLSAYVEKGVIIGTLADGSTGFRVSTQGALDATNAVIRGTIYAGSGAIGGWIIDTDKIYTAHDDSGKLGTGMSSNSGRYAFWAGETNNAYGTVSSDAIFRVGQDGGLYAANATIVGNITATSGTVGCWVMDTNRIYDTTYTAGTGAGINKYGAGQAFWAGGSDLTGNDAPFHVDHEGNFVSTKATITGTVSATVFDINGSQLYITTVSETYTSMSVNDMQNDFSTLTGILNQEALYLDSNTHLHADVTGDRIIGTYMNAQTLDVSSVMNVETAYIRSLRVLGSMSSYSFISSGTGFYGAWIELSSGTPYIDFHYNGNSSASVDYTSRIIENSSGALSVNGVICSESKAAVNNGIYLGGWNSEPYIYTTDNGNILLRYLDSSGNRGYANIRNIHSATTSDVRLKTNVVNTNVYAMDTINSILVRQFDWITGSEHQCIGFIADELETIDSRFSIGGGYYEDGSMNVKTVNTLYMLGYVVKGMQELSLDTTNLQASYTSQQARIESLEYQLAQAFNKIAQLEAQIEG